MLFYKIKRYILFKIKSIELFWDTLKKKYEIQKAYNEAHKIEKSYKKSFKKINFRNLGRNLKKIIFIFLIFVTAGISTYFIIRYSFALYNNITKKVNEFVVLQKKKALEREKAEALQKIKQEDKKLIPSAEDAKRIKEVPSEDIKKEKNVVNLEIVSDIDSNILGECKIDRKLKWFLIANKKDSTLYVYKFEKIWSLKDKFKIGTGKNGGPKFKAGDMKTPEGLYIIIGRMEDRELPPIYGYLAYVLNYPNDEDRKNNKNGQGIWIHGTHPDSMPNFTKGCIETSNRDLKKLSYYLKRGIGTPVYIINRDNVGSDLILSVLSKAKEERDKELKRYVNVCRSVKEFIYRWKNAWESKDINLYESFYDTANFYGQGNSWTEWKERKLRTFKYYKNINIEIKSVFLSAYGKTNCKVKFIQRYKSDRLDVINGKMLKLKKKNNSWIIVNEETFPQEELIL